MATSLDGIVTGLNDLSFDKNRVNKSQSSDRAVGGELGKDEFLQLLVCQMKNQDPLEPEKDTQFIAQLAQFSALEQMQNLNETAVNSQAFGLVGKAVVLNTKSTNGSITEVQGVVDYIAVKNGTAQLSVNGQLYSIDDLVEVNVSNFGFKNQEDSNNHNFDQKKGSAKRFRVDAGEQALDGDNVSQETETERQDGESIVDYTA